tara:strand:+ start:731 stop:1045 length:315 start_codon:yes stop_codon:yes gene_type:complete
MSLDQNISVRVTQLGLKHSQISDALGISAQGWYAMRTATNPTLKTMVQVGVVLACPHHLLLGADVGQVVAQPIPQWDWLAWVKEQQQAGKLNELTWEDVERAAL